MNDIAKYNHPNIVKLNDTKKKGNKFYAIMVYCDPLKGLCITLFYKITIYQSKKFCIISYKLLTTIQMFILIKNHTQRSKT